MIPKLIIACAVFQIVPLGARAEWNLLRGQDGSAAEVAIDFTIDEIQIDDSGDVTISARSTKDHEEIGFIAVFTRARPGVMPGRGTEEDRPVARSDVTVKSVGRPTANLERLLALQFASDGGGESGLRFVGLYSGICPEELCSVAHRAVFYAMSVGISFDDAGERIAGDCYSLILGVDGPLKRVTAYISRPAGYGGESPAYRARADWYESQKKKKSG